MDTERTDIKKIPKQTETLLNSIKNPENILIEESLRYKRKLKQMIQNQHTFKSKIISFYTVKIQNEFLMKDEVQCLRSKV